MNKSEELIKLHEGWSNKPYKDTEGILTIGVGCNLEKGITNEAVDFLFSESMSDVIKDCRSLAWYPALSEARQAVIQNMIFNLGLSRFLGFKRTIAMIESGDYYNASKEMLNSKWAKQVGSRSSDLSKMMRYGEF